jgi:hypothetical protein
MAPAPLFFTGGSSKMASEVRKRVRNVSVVILDRRIPVRGFILTPHEN